MEIYVDAYDCNDALRRAMARKQEFETGPQLYLLLYCALDTRLCIERTLFEYLLLIENNDLSERLEKIYSASDLKRAILAAEPAFFRKLPWRK
jgi:hypothetical protein